MLEAFKGDEVIGPAFLRTGPFLDHNGAACTSVQFR